jgi:protein-disulfide isomerase
MTTGHTQRLLILAALLIPALSPAGGRLQQAECPEVSPAERQALVKYVSRKFRLPKDLPIGLVLKESLGSSCYQKIEFSSLNPSTYFRYAAVLCPGHQLLARDIADTTLDPLKGDAEAEGRVQRELLAGDPPSLGPPSAPVTLVVFSDFQCPYCRQEALAVRSEVLPAVGSKVRVVMRHFPLGGGHDWASFAAGAAACVAAQNKDGFWALHDYFFQEQQQITQKNVFGKAAGVVRSLPGVDFGQYDKCVAAHGANSVVEQDRALGQSNGVEGTPTLFVNGKRMQFTGAADLLRSIREAEADK